MPDTAWNALPSLPDTNVTTHQGRQYCYPHFAGKKNKTQESIADLSRAASYQGVDVRHEVKWKKPQNM